MEGENETLRDGAVYVLQENKRFRRENASLKELLHKFERYVRNNQLSMRSNQQMIRSSSEMNHNQMDSTK